MGGKACQDFQYLYCGQSVRWEGFYLPFCLWRSRPREKQPGLLKGIPAHSRTLELDDLHGPSNPSHFMILWRKTVNVTCSLWEWVCHGVQRRVEGWGTFMQRICPHLAHKREALWKTQSKGAKWPAHCLHTFSWGTTVTGSFYQIPGKQDITEFTFLNPHLLIGIVMGYDSGLWENVHLLIMWFK